MNIATAERLALFVTAHLADNDRFHHKYLRRNLDYTEPHEWVESLTKALGQGLITPEDFMQDLVGAIEYTIPCPTPLLTKLKNKEDPENFYAVCAVCEACHERFGEENRTPLYGFEWCETGVWPGSEYPCDSCKEPVRRDDHSNLYVYQVPQ